MLVDSIEVTCRLQAHLKVKTSYRDVLTSSIKSRTLRWTGHVARMEEGGSPFKMFTGKRPLRKPRRKWEEWFLTN